MVGFGLPGGRSNRTEWPVVTPADQFPADLEGPAIGVVPFAAEVLNKKLWTNVGRSVMAALKQTFPSSALHNQTLRVWPELSEDVYFTLNGVFTDIYRRARLQRCDIWLANDWTAGTLAKRLAREQGVPFGYDTHELAIDEYAEHWRWRMRDRPLIRAIEGEVARQAAVVSCVSHGIARRLVEIHELKSQPLVIRNVPYYQPTAIRHVGATIRILYHGLVVPGRGLEETISSVPLWRSEFDLTIRGPADEAYKTSLVRLARSLGVERRVIFAPPVPMVDLVREAAVFDIGLFLSPPNKLQNVHVLPNKIFEYVMAGLAVCVSDMPEMARIVETHQVGRLISSMDPKMVAKEINSLERASINQYKSSSVAAARELNWDIESIRLIDAYATAVGTVTK